MSKSMNNPEIEGVLEKEINPIEELRNRVGVTYENIEGQYYEYIEGIENGISNVSENIRNTARSVNEFMNTVLKGMELPTGNKVMIALTTLAIISAITAGSAMNAKAQVVECVTPNVGEARVRTDADPNSQVIGSLYRGEQLQIVSNPEGPMIIINWNGMERSINETVVNIVACGGTTEQPSVQATEAPVVEQPQQQVPQSDTSGLQPREIQGGQSISGSANVRTQPSINSESMGNLTSFAGTVTGNVETTVVDANGETWTQVVLADGRVGWVSDRLTNYSNGDNDSSTNSNSQPQCDGSADLRNITFSSVVPITFFIDSTLPHNGRDGVVYTPVDAGIGTVFPSATVYVDTTRFDYNPVCGDMAGVVYFSAGETFALNGMNCTVDFSYDFWNDTRRGEVNVFGTNIENLAGLAGQYGSNYVLITSNAAANPLAKSSVGARCG
jgi:hypothetical protein